jgi:hypothetical protein
MPSNKKGEREEKVKEICPLRVYSHTLSFSSHLILSFLFLAFNSAKVQGLCCGFALK